MIDDSIILRARGMGRLHEFYKTIKQMVDEGDVVHIPCLDESHADIVERRLRYYEVGGTIEKSSFVDTSRGHIVLADHFFRNIPIPAPKVRWSIKITP